MADILILDDDASIRQLLGELILDLGHRHQAADNLVDGLSLARKQPFDIILLDLDFPEGNGLSLMPALSELASTPEIIIITGTGNAESAETAFKYGAWNYVRKPFMIETVSLQITRALQYHAEKMRPKTPAVLKRDSIIGESEAIGICLDEVARAAVTDSSVLIYGETGTGKELFAAAIHQNSLRCDETFVVIDCGALPETLVESILFGHEKGAFTGAESRREGLIVQADGGTLFLDEIGELDLAVQKKLLRTLQEHRLRPVGAKKEIQVDFRLVAATNRDLEQMVREHTFREDLLFRIRGIEIHLPPLRERRADIRPIAYAKVQQIGDRCGLGSKGMSVELIEILEQFDWPGNVRELISVLENVVANAGADPTLVPKHLPPKYRTAFLDFDDIQNGNDDPAQMLAPFHDAAGRVVKWSDYRIRIEKDYLQFIVQQSRSSWQEACRLSGLSKTRLYELLKKHGLSISPGQ